MVICLSFRKVRGDENFSPPLPPTPFTQRPRSVAGAEVKREVDAVAHGIEVIDLSGDEDNPNNYEVITLDDEDDGNEEEEDGHCVVSGGQYETLDFQNWSECGSTLITTCKL